MCRETDGLENLTYRAGTFLRYICPHGSDRRAAELEDICYIYRENGNESEYWTALSLETSMSSLGLTVEEAYRNLIFLLLCAMRDNLLNYPHAALGTPASHNMREKALCGHRVTDHIQRAHLRQALEEFQQSVMQEQNVSISFSRQLSYRTFSMSLADTRVDEAIYADVAGE